MKKKIHIINPYGTLPDEGWRKYRTNIVAEYLSQNGYEIVYWISNIDHRSKKKRCEENTERRYSDNLLFKIIVSSEYEANGSLKRIFYEKKFGKEVAKIFVKENHRADAILVTDPALFYAPPLMRLAKKIHAKFFIDILDLWPEAFIALIPKPFRFLDKIILAPLFGIRKKIYRNTDGFLSVTHDYLESVKKICPQKPMRVVYIGIEKIMDSVQEDKIIDGDEIRVIYAGTLGINYDIKTLLQLAERIEKSTFNIQLFIAGDGPMKQEVEEFIVQNQYHKTQFLGRLEVEKLNSLYSTCHVALSTYIGESTVSMPVKAFDYLAFGLPVINSLGREYGAMVEEKKIGLQYEAENVESLYQQLLKMVKNRDLLMDYMKNARLLSEMFQLDKQYDKYVDFINQNLK